jgi:D-alanine-D-alanine ligase
MERTVAEVTPDRAVVFGGPSPEHDVSVLTGLQASRALGARCLYWTKTGEWYEVDPGLEASAFVDGVPKGSTRVQLLFESGFTSESGRLGRPRPLGIAVAVVCCHGGPGEDGTLQAALDLAGVRYTGPTLAGAALGMDKLSFGEVAGGAGLPTLPRTLLDKTTSDVGFGPPYIVKPRFGGSSIGIAANVADLQTAVALLGANRHLRAGAVIEPYRADLFDLQVAVRSWPELALSAVERPLRTARAGGAAGEPEILGYADKYRGGEGMASAPRELPAAIDSGLEQTLRDVAGSVARLCSVRGVMRVDFLSDGRELFVNEINTIPGSLARYLWIDPTVSFRTLLCDMVDEAIARPSHHYTAEGADGTVLKGAASIAAKLA